MSAPLSLTPYQLRDLATALEAFSKVRREQHVSLTPYAPIDVGIGDSTVRVRWDEESEQYVVDDRNGD